MHEPIPLSELNKIKSLELNKYSSIPILYEKEIRDIFDNIIPKLIVSAEDYHTLYNKTTADPIQAPLTEENTKLLKTLLKAEDKLIRIAEQNTLAMRSHCNRKKDLLKIAYRSVHVPWYVKFWRWIKEKAY